MKRRIAIVEDEEDLRSLLAILIRNLGHEVVFVARDGKEIVEAIQNDLAPDLILMDYRMPVMNGMQAAYKIRSTKPSVRIVIVSADDSIKDEVQSQGLVFLEKPFSIAMLAETVGQVLAEPAEP